MEAAGIPKVTKEGKLDFHGLRTTCATLLVESGASVKETQVIMRHSDPRLTMNIYAKVRQGTVGDAVERVAALALEGGEKN